MAKRSASELYSSALDAGFQPPQALILAEIEEAESNGDDTALGDVGLQDATWGPSEGAPQVRTLKRQTGTGGYRDIQWLQGNLAHQQQAAYAISKGGADFSPWSTFTNGAYTKYRDLVAASVGPRATAAAGSSTTVGNPLTSVVDDWRGIALQLAGGLAGAALIVAGMLQLGGPALRGKLKSVLSVAKVAAL